MTDAEIKASLFVVRAVLFIFFLACWLALLIFVGLIAGWATTWLMYTIGVVDVMKWMTTNLPMPGGQ